MARQFCSGCATALLDCLRAKSGRSIIGPNFGPKLSEFADTRQHSMDRRPWEMPENISSAIRADTQRNTAN